MENKAVVAIRADSSTSIGSGHIMRCLTLAEQLRNSGAEVFFICLELAGNMIPLIEKKGYVVEIIPHIKVVQDDMWKKDLEYTKKIIKCSKKQIHWLIVDHYGLDNRWENGLRTYTKRVMVIDDLANRQHDCDLLLDQNFYSDMALRYQGVTPSHCTQLLGPQYALLRPEFYKARNNQRKRDGKIRRVLLFFGGSDPTNETVKALAAIKLLNWSAITIDVVVGMANSNKEYIKQLCDNLPNTIFHCQVNNMAELMANADLAIGAGGTATWERCFLGLPSLTVVVADNQDEVTTAVAQAGATIKIGYSWEATVQRIAESVAAFLDNPTLVKRMSEKALELMGIQNPINTPSVVKLLLEDNDVKSRTVSS
jgi:UDP-2,4-diacetamido-2,4,6-trideoxy-beta-L-altropyranose hydrolase